MPDNNVERLLTTTSVPVDPDDLRRLDLIVPGLNVFHGLPLFCDATVISPLTATGAARGGTSNRGGTLLEQAETDNNATYADVPESGLGTLLCLGCEVFGRWSRQSVHLVPRLAHARASGMHPRIRRGAAFSFQHRWWGLLCIALQKAVSHLVRNQVVGADLVQTQLEPMPCLSDVSR